MTRITSKEIQLWTDTFKKESEQLLPELIRRLVSSLCETESLLRIPSGNSISSPGYDGTVTVIKGNGFFPEGKCVVEIGTNKAIKDKADEDYQKRKTDPKCEPKETNYIFVTSRLFSGGNDWCTEKRKDKFWKSVTVIHADDLEYLLEKSLPCSLWFAEVLGKPSSLESIEYALSKFLSSTQNKLTSNIVTLSRDKETAELIEALRGNGRKVEVKSDSQIEAYGFILSTLILDESLKNKCVVVYNENDLNFISLHCEELIVIPRFIPKTIGMALENGHTLIFPNGKEGLKNIGINSTILLNRMDRENRIVALTEILGDKDLAVKVYADTRGYFYQILRHPSLNPNISTDVKWLKEFDSKLLHTILFFTEWVDEQDGVLLSACLGKDYNEILKDLEKLSKYEDSPIRLIGNNTWQVISKSDLFTLMGKEFDMSSIKNYEPVVLRALTDEDTSFELEKKDRWCAAIYDKGTTYSVRVKQGISDSLCLLADIGDRNTQDYVNKIIREIFQTTQNPYKLIYNLGSNIRLIAEASPEVFLNYIEENINGLAGLFDQGVADFFHSRSEHVNLMWALEIVAWNREFLPRVANILTQLSEKYEDKIQANLSNRPIGSLSEIFILWQRSTNATLEDKVAILRKISIDHPKLIFELIIKILQTRTSSTSAKPVYRDWGDIEYLGVVTNKEYYDYAIACIELLIDLFKLDVEQCYIAVLDIINDFPIIKQNEILDCLLACDFHNFEIRGVLEARKNIRDIIMREYLYDQKFLGDMHKLLAVYNILISGNLILENEYMFNGGYAVFIISRKDDYKKSDFGLQEEIAKEERIKTIKLIYTTLGVSGIKELVLHLQNQFGIIQAIIDSGIMDEDLYKQIFNLLDEENQQLFTFSINLLNTLSRNKNQNFIDSRNAIQQITPERKLARFILAIDDPKDKFGLLRKQNIEIQEIFWQDIQKLNWWWILRDDGFSEANYVLTELNQRGLLNISFEILSNISHSHQLDCVDVEIIFKTFELLVPFINSGKHIQSVDYYLKEILEYLYGLEKDGKVSANDILSLEIQYIKTLESPRVINRTLAEKPEFLVDLIIKVYKARSEENKVVSDEEQRIASNVFHILHNFTQIPGTKDDGEIDEKFLINYVEVALKLLKECDRLEIGSQKIGEILAHSPMGKDNIWPCEAVRNTIDKFKSEHIVKGFDVGKSNLRGTTVRAMFEGGSQERELSKQYFNWAKELQISHPFTSKALRELGRHYEYQAEREDVRVELDRD